MLYFARASSFSCDFADDILCVVCKYVFDESGEIYTVRLSPFQFPLLTWYFLRACISSFDSLAASFWAFFALCVGAEIDFTVINRR